MNSIVSGGTYLIVSARIHFLCVLRGFVRLVFEEWWLVWRFLRLVVFLRPPVAVCGDAPLSICKAPDLFKRYVLFLTCISTGDVRLNSLVKGLL